MIHVEHVTKRFYTLTALADVSVSIRRGEVIGLLGPNGAGKTTLFKIVAGLLNPDDGRIRPTGFAWPRVALKPERLLFPNHLRVGQYLKMMAGLSNLSSGEVDTAVINSLRQVDLLDAVGKRIRTCSKGMRQRLGLAQALIGDPPLVLLDEPTNGLDPEGQEDILTRIKALQAAGKSVVMSSHQLHEVTQVCSHLVILNEGHLLYQNSMSEALAARTHIIIQTAAELAEPVRLQLVQMHPDVSVSGNTIRLEGEAMALARQILTMLLKLNLDVVHVEQKRITLAEIYAEAVQ
ncbi:MAG: ABC transporter ATP-binding protein [Anaerolineae bacterium]